MKICFIWVRNFRNLKNFGLNLCSKYHYIYNDEENYLSQTPQQPLPDKFYGEGVSDVTGLFGKNGSGKSNSLELICLALKGGKSKINSDFLIIYESEDSLMCELSIKRLNGLGPKNNFNISYKKYDGDIKGINVIYFSNVYDQRKNEFPKSVSDLSMNSIARKNGYKSHSFFEQIDFIKSKKFTYLDIPVPEQFCIDVDVSIRFKSNFIRVEVTVALEKLDTLVKSRLRELKPNSKLLLLLSYSSLLWTINSIFESYDHEGKVIDGLLNPLFEQHFSSKELSIELIKITAQIGKHYLNDTKQLDLEVYLDQLDEIVLSPSYFEIENVKVISNKQSLIINNLNFNSKEFSDLLEVCRINGKIQCSWLGISSGHLAYMNLFSSIYHELFRTRNDALLCIDEGDLYLHPEWQIEFFDKLLSVLPNLSSGKVQLVLTSHSPFLLSDLPNQSVTVFNAEERLIASHGKEIEQKTFGANLYELYSDLFFLGKNRTGVFASKKITKILEEASVDSTGDEKKEFGLLTELLGDKIVKYGLEKRLSDD